MKGGKQAAGGGMKQPNWLMFGIWMLVAFVLIKQFTSPPPKQTGPKTTSSQYYAKLVDENHKLLEASAAKTYNDYKSALNDEISEQKELVKNGKAPQSSLQPLEDSLLQKQIDGAVLVADAQLRGGRVTGAYEKYWLAFNTLQEFELKQATNPDWSTRQIKTENRKGVVKYWTGAALYQEVVHQLSNENQHTLLYGFLPGYQIIDFTVGMTGKIPGFSYWFSALLLAVVVRGMVWPLTARQIRYGRQMQQLMPRIKEIKAANGKDMAAQQKETMALYKEYGINPMMGCFPLIIQTPFFIAIYDCMLRYRFEYQKGVFAWINPHTSAATHGFIAPNLGQQDTILLVVYTLTMLSSQLLMPVSDPTQVKQQRIMGVVMSIAIPGSMLLGFYVLPSAFVLYWTFTNIISTTQALLAYRQPVPPLERVRTTDGGIIPGRKISFIEKIQMAMESKYEAARGASAHVEAAPKKRGGFYDRIQEEAKKALEDKRSNQDSDGTSSSNANKNGSGSKASSNGQGSKSGSNGQSSKSGSGGQGKKPKRRT